jgi:hypothetical protein
MTIDAIIPMMQLPYTINLETKDQDLEQLHQNISLSTEPIISLNTLKLSFDIDNYVVKSYKWEQPSLTGTTLDGQELPTHIKQLLQGITDREMKREGKQYIELTKEDIKQLFSIELYRDKQLNKIL